MNQEPNYIKVAVRCNDCKHVIGYKLAKGGGRVQLKCPKCGCEVIVDLSLRRSNVPIFCRKTRVPIRVKT